MQADAGHSSWEIADWASWVSDRCWLDLRLRQLPGVGFSNDGRIDEVRDSVEVEGLFEAISAGAITAVLEFGWLSGILLGFVLYGSYMAYRDAGLTGGTIFAVLSLLAGLLLVLPLFVLAVGTLIRLIRMAANDFEHIPIREAAQYFTDRELRKMATYMVLTACHLSLAYFSGLGAANAARLSSRG